nr:immunoglobulin heavy chain junction region [Macaca mulatta]MOV35636.1 immunoglobulin heavy chain junction region [Macaca mulatta]MOV35677.1 immunoglobulin heavy chain junction region [Macaca mulatta]MOV35704.1 immunoglobulin heavy chain junction region [Macaca mulatta]
CARQNDYRSIYDYGLDPW